MASPTRDELAFLADQVRGPVFGRGQDGYAAELAGFQTGFHPRPAVVVGAADAEDVRAAVRFAAERGLAVAVRSTGHGVTVPVDGGVLISTKRLAEVTVHPEGRYARIGAGARWSAVVALAEPHGLVPPSGSAGHVGVVGYTLAGGMGLLAREVGYAADHVRAVDVVTADGDLRHVTAATDPDLFWALRGGRDNFGVVTSLEIGLRPVERIYGGGIYFGSEHAEAVLAFFRDWTARAPETITASVGMIGYPPLPVFPEPLRGRHVLHVRFATTDIAEGPGLIQPWRAVAPTLIDAVGELAYRDAGSIYREPDFAHAYDGNSALLSDLPPEVLDAIIGLAGADAAVGCVVDLRHLGGALAREPAAPSAVSFRAANYILRVLSSPEGVGLAEVRATHQRLFDAVRPWTLGRSLNFVYGERAAADFRSELYEKPTLDRLSALKAVHDPGNVFRANHNIEPARRR
ncbi:FAD-binding oxidoreductase [Actinokineospora iranica]|uniref:FAD/FMN-containing dehydrogenase n=1 Tax=Actinokineospora iranica TaxID=1271860 RepID=A0A1G6JZP6_9PSEU|nr:FAD-binding oxidoreductase [Actinokineospora iranica]SDC24210.1 FAD/FMN-containing dehydrogenase [Actinokineospora iranica]